ncbi:MAG: metal-binding protein, partial [Planctomycetes bacterium]|nr:metal-binding protein [Planctomycetota bacterium]
MLQTQPEVERTFEVDDAFAVPTLSGVQGVGSLGPPVDLALDSAYVDTADLRLAAAGITLRRRTGGTDAGWHLKLPVD